MQTFYATKKSQFGYFKIQTENENAARKIAAEVLGDDWHSIHDSFEKIPSPNKERCFGRITNDVETFASHFGG